MFIKDEEMKGKVSRFSKKLWQALRKRSSPFFGKDACTFSTQAFTPGFALVNAQLYQNLVKSISHEPDVEDLALSENVRYHHVFL